MKKVFFLLAVSLLSGASVYAQDYVIDQVELQDTIEKKVITLIPFQNKYYRSEIDRSLGMSENINFQDLRDGLRKELDKQLFMILDDDFEVKSFLKNDSEEEREILDYVFYGTAGSYTALEENEKVERGLVKNGQIKEAPVEEGQRYMKTVIHHPPLISTLNKASNSDYYLFIGELDILLPTTPEHREKSRYIYVHYTLYNVNGEILDSGMLSQLIASKKCKKVKDISLYGFAPIAYQFKNTLEEFK